jgi:hypothetical protein
MGLRSDHVLDVVVRPVLARLEAEAGVPRTVAAEQLVLGTLVHEGAGLSCLRQLARRDGRRGPGVGLGQMEPATHEDHWRTYLAYRPRIARVVASLSTVDEEALHEILVHQGPEFVRLWKFLPPAAEMGPNLAYAAAMVRVHYLPEAGDVEALAVYWDVHYNRNPREGFPGEFIESWTGAGLGGLWP